MQPIKLIVLAMMLLSIAFANYAMITSIKQLSNADTNYSSLLLGDTHDQISDHRSIIMNGLIKRAKKQSPALAIYVEDPFAIPGFKSVKAKKGVLPGLVKKINKQKLPAVCVENFDTRAICHSAMYLLTNCPHSNHSIPGFNDFTFGNLITEFDEQIAYAQKSIAPSFWFKPQLAQINESKQNFCMQLKQYNISLGDGIVHKTVELFCNEQDNPYYQGATPYTSARLKEALICKINHTNGDRDTCHTTMKSFIKECLPEYYGPRYLLTNSLFELDLPLTSLAAYLKVCTARSNSLLIAGQNHTDQVRTWLMCGSWNPQSYFFNQLSPDCFENI